MQEFYWACLISGIIFALVALIFDNSISDFLEGIFDFPLDYLEPVVIRSAITIFGGAGIVLSESTSLGKGPVFLLSLVLAFLLSILVYFIYVKPMKKAENSIGFSIRELIGKSAEVIVPIPEKGFGQVLIKTVSGYTHEVAASSRGESLATGAQVKILDVKDNVLYVDSAD